MEDHVSLIEALVEKTVNYGRTSAELLKLKTIDKSADIISSLTARLIILVFIGLFFLILNIGVALWIGETLKKYCLGFFVVAGFYAVITALLYVFRNKWIKAPIQNSIITKSLK